MLLIGRDLLKAHHVLDQRLGTAHCPFAQKLFLGWTTPDDNIPGLSIEDKEFFALMEHESYKDEEGCWTAPLPFRRDRIRLPNNRVQALRRAKSLDYNLQKHPENIPMLMNL
ncbi:Hypothetical predicted protein [Mytilus galloprovincialis]|uniref:Uncharacterized protein n=1 Tax=Mytilus galloprovincialis TaxID=29158 RepID=A0A8B6E6Z2_MYTGA|nr:Hypothetical predicted protein [Mytilus galloprovincialis]